MKLVEQYTGIGRLVWRDQTFADIPYDVSRFQAMTASGLPVPGLHRIEGRVDLGNVPQRAELAGGLISLEFEDGRSMKLTVTDEAGSVLAEGHGPGRCMCC